MQINMLCVWCADSRYTWQHQIPSGLGMWVSVHALALIPPKRATLSLSWVVDSGGGVAGPSWPSFHPSVSTRHGRAIHVHNI